MFVIDLVFILRKGVNYTVVFSSMKREFMQCACSLCDCGWLSSQILHLTQLRTRLVWPPPTHVVLLFHNVCISKSWSVLM